MPRTWIRTLPLALLLALAAPSASWGAQCSDGLDGDDDGLADYPFDPGCTSPMDDSEWEPGVACDDGIDNDGDGWTDYRWDTGCTDRTDGDETEPGHPCQDGLDNDGDGLVDVAEDPGCGDWKIEDPTCDDGIDNDGDGLFDYPEDPGCRTAYFSSEIGQCQNGRDDDGDGLGDWPDDPGCADAYDTYETDPALVCDDGRDNDHDDLHDGTDPGCSDAFDASESDGDPVPATGCADGIDNDGDGKTDRSDPHCENGWGYYVPQWNEIGVCADGVDNDGDGLVDWPDDPDCADEDGTERLADTAILTFWRESPGDLGQDGRFYSGFGEDEILPDGTYIPVIPPEGDGQGGVPEGSYFSSPFFETDPAGNRYLYEVVDRRQLFRVAADGTATVLLGPWREGEVGVASSGVRYGADGFVTVLGGGAWRIGPDDEKEPIPVPDGFDSTIWYGRVGHNFEVDSRGTIYILLKETIARPDPALRPGVIAVGRDGKVRRLIDAGGDGKGHPLHEPRWLDVTPGGTVFVSGRENVFRIRRSGRIEWLMGPDGDGMGNRLSLPGVRVDEAGDAWILGGDHTFFVSREGGMGAVTSLARGWVIPGWDGTNYLSAGSEHYILEMPPVCSNGIDDDGDGQTDYPEDPFCLDADWHTETWQPRCGLGFELVFVLPPLLWLRRRLPRGR